MRDDRTGLPFRTLAWEGGIDGHFLVLDQRQLPHRVEEIEIDSARAAFEAIRTLAVRGAPAIGVAAAYACVVGARAGATTVRVRECLAETRALLARARPTAYNLFWAIARMGAADPGTDGTREDLLARLHAAARAIHDEDAAACAAIGRHGLALLPDPIRAMTHCNAGALAATGIGTALAPLYAAHAQGRAVSVYARETRPLLQGARLTAWELSRAGIDVTLLADGAAGHLMHLGRINCVIVGADRIALNGDTANKIGTYPLAIAARHHGIPFYVAAPSSTFDPDAPDGRHIAIEERSREEVAHVLDLGPVAPADVPCVNPAFDVTPAGLIAAIITERGIAAPPSAQTLAALAF